MPTIEELFKSKKLTSGKTAEQQYAVRNSKDAEIRTAAGALGLPFKAATAIRRKLSSTGTETLIEEETTGLRIISKLSSPLIYGTDIIRLTRKSTDLVNTMKSAANGSGGSGILGGLLDKAKSKLTDFASSKLGISFPQTLIPSSLIKNKDFKSGLEPNTMETLSKIREGKGGLGGLVGKFLKQSLSGKTADIGKNLLGNAAQIGKDKLNGLLFGGIKEGSAKVGTILMGKDGKALQQNGRLLPQIYSSLLNTENRLGVGIYSSRKKLLNETPPEDANDLSTRLLEVMAEPKYQSAFFPSKANKIAHASKTKSSAFVYSQDEPYTFIKNVDGDNTIETKRKVTSNKDSYNEENAYTGENKNIDGSSDSIDGMDFVALKFYSVAKDSGVNFRATITGLTETYAPTWDSQKFIGNPFNFHTYTGIERSIQFNFKVYSLSAKEHLAAWNKLNFLASLVYPQSYGGSEGIYVTPPFLKFTLGDMFKSKECFIDSLIYTIDDNNMWEIGLNDAMAKDYKLPTIIDVGVTLKFVEQKSNTSENRLYGFGGTSTAVPTAAQKKEGVKADGAAKPAEKKTQSDKAISLAAKAAEKAKEKANSAKAAVDKVKSATAKVANTAKSNLDNALFPNKLF